MSSHKKGVTTSYHNSGQKNIHVNTENGEVSIYNAENKDDREIVIRDKDGSVRRKKSGEYNYKKDE